MSKSEASLCYICIHNLLSLRLQFLSPPLTSSKYINKIPHSGLLPPSPFKKAFDGNQRYSDSRPSNNCAELKKNLRSFAVLGRLHQTGCNIANDFKNIRVIHIPAKLTNFLQPEGQNSPPNSIVTD